MKCLGRAVVADFVVVYGGSLCVTESAIQPLLGCGLCMVFVWWVYV